MTDAISRGPAFPGDIDNYPAGPEMDSLLAERVLGARIGWYKAWGGYTNLTATIPNGEVLYIQVSPHFDPVPLWNPSINLADTEVLVQYLFMHSDYGSMTGEGTEEAGYYVTLWARRPLDKAFPGAPPGHEPERVETYTVTGYGSTPALAVCRAVYKAASDVRPRQVG